MFDLVIRNATVIDGTGVPGRRADVGVRDGRIESIGVLPGETPAARTIEAADRVLAPGFIDIHTHSDLHLIADGLGESKLRQGVTTEVTGNCSFAPFPIESARIGLHMDHLARATAPIPLDWSDLDGYARALDRAGLGLNVAPLAGHGTLRVCAMGVDQRPPNPDELTRMKRELDRSLEQGAWGLTTGLTHVPSAYGEFDEVEELVRLVARHGGLYASHGRASGAVTETVDIGKATGARVQHSHLALNDPAKWGTAAALLADLEDAAAAGVDIAFDVYPYVASSSALTQYLPPWVQAGGTDAMRARLSQPTERARALRDMAAGWFGGIPFLWDRFTISDSPDGYGIARTIDDLAAETDTDPYEFTLSLCERYGNTVGVVLFYRSETDVEAFLAHPMGCVGSDGNAVPLRQGSARIHPRSFGTFPRVLGRYVRERGTLSLASAVNKLSGRPAEVLRLKGRGLIRLGYAADLVLLDPETVADTTDFGQQPSAPLGIDLVVVNGTVMVDHGVVGTDRPGHVLLRGQ
ncbi:N-acyl-D-amino-acid deacylase family protein [Nakamurella lactea]|uniref:N-acyl-D-amino-acid deacylase family protein n=1 Tax=Nakamurella lactea TaxID=459515 RepID=UPI00056B40B0|nr:D-aminoacylase [Nakamurella lactea]